MSRKIEIVCTDGSPLGVTSKTIWGDSFRVGVGGAELALLTMCEEWTKQGHDVILYNDPHEVNASPFEQRFRMDFDIGAKHDVLITFRSPSIKTVATDAELKVWWSCDQYTIDDFRKFSTQVDKVVGISAFHSEHFKAVYDIDNMIVIDLPVRVDDYNVDVEKIPNRFLFSSVPDRGLHNMWRLWKAIRNNIPEATLVITSDYRLWGTDANNRQHRAEWMLLMDDRNDITFSGAVNRHRLIQEQLKTEIYLYPCSYDELFCIACSEAQYAGAYSITSGQGALATTNMGINVPVDTNDPRNDELFIDQVMKYYSNSQKETLRRELQEKAAKRFHPDRILQEWEDKVFS